MEFAVCIIHIHIMRNLEINLTTSEMLTQAFRNACRGYGTYCPNKNELRIRKRRMVYRFRCGESELRFVAPGREELLIHIAPDATALEFKRCFDYLIESHQTNDLQRDCLVQC